MTEIDWERLRSAQKVWRQRENPTAQLSLLTDAGIGDKVCGRLSLDSEEADSARSFVESFQPPEVEDSDGFSID